MADKSLKSERSLRLALVAGAGIRLALFASPRWSRTLAERVEVTTPVTSWKRRVSLGRSKTLTVQYKRAPSCTTAGSTRTPAISSLSHRCCWPCSPACHRTKPHRHCCSPHSISSALGCWSDWRGGSGGEIGKTRMGARRGGRSSRGWSDRCASGEVELSVTLQLPAVAVHDPELRRTEHDRHQQPRRALFRLVCRVWCAFRSEELADV